MHVQIRWHAIQRTDDPRWKMNLCLYAYVAPRFDEILYIGKTYGRSVRQRWTAIDKRNFWRELERVRGIFKHALIVGEITLIGDEYMPRFSRKKVADVESLLIFKVQPWENISCRNSRIERSNMVVRCSGDWPLQQKTFREY